MKTESDSSFPFEPEQPGDELTPQLLEAWRSRMRRWCSHELGREYSSRVDTSDVVQESMVQLWQDWDRFRGQTVGEIRSWMYQVAKGHLHKARRFHRAAKRNVQTESSNAVDPSECQTATPDREAVRAEERLRLSIAVEQLPPHLKQVVQLRIFGQMSFREVGEVIDVDKGEARNLFLQALRRLRLHFDNDTQSSAAPKEALTGRQSSRDSNVST